MARHALPAALAVLAVVTGVLAWWPGPARGDAAPLAPHVTPVLSPRRLPGLLADAVADARLTRALDLALADPALGAAKSCLVVDDRGRRLYAHQPDESLIPASNLKLLTATAALHDLGAGTRLRTEVRAQVDGAGNVAGDLWLVGGGDPLLGTGDYAATFERQPQVFTPLEELARRVKAAGVNQIQGRVVGDETRYDTQRYLPTWKPGYIADNEIGPESALTVNDNFSQWRPRHVPAAHPATNAAEVFTNLLRANGVTVVGVPGEGAVRAGTPVVASIESPPMTEITAQMVRESDNLTAELLTKELAHKAGHQGATATGVGVARSTLQKLGLSLTGLTAVDGSGLDRSNRATCNLLIAALEDAGDTSPLARGLAVANRTGTLTKRFVGNPAAGKLRAKTGSLDGVAALSGFADTRGGTLTFSLVVNGLPRDALGPQLWERVGALLVGWPDAPDPTELGPR